MDNALLERVKRVISERCSSEREFAKRIGSNPKTVNQQIRGERTLSLDTVYNILSSFEDVSSEWLLRGTGDMTTAINLSKCVDNLPANSEGTYNEFSKRFLDVIDALGVTDDSVRTSIESIDRERVSNIRNGIGGISLTMIRDFCLYYENVNVEYIITGKGTPLKLDPTDVIKELVDLKEENLHLKAKLYDYQNIDEKGKKKKSA